MLSDGFICLLLTFKTCFYYLSLPVVWAEYWGTGGRCHFGLLLPRARVPYPFLHSVQRSQLPLAIFQHLLSRRGGRFGRRCPCCFPTRRSTAAAVPAGSGHSFPGRFALLAGGAGAVARVVARGNTADSVAVCVVRGGNTHLHGSRLYEMQGHRYRYQRGNKR